MKLEGELSAENRSGNGPLMFTGINTENGNILSATLECLIHDRFPNLGPDFKGIPVRIIIEKI
jgi:hypothetical protein